MHRAVLSLVLIGTQHVGSLAQSGSHCSAQDESTWQLTWCVMSGCWSAEQVCPYSCGRHRQPSHRRLKDREKGGDGGHSAAVNTVFHHTRWWWWWWCNILTKNTPPSTFRARLPVTLVKWIIWFITSVDKNLFDSPTKTMFFLSGGKYLNCVHVLFWQQQTQESSFTAGRCKMTWSAVWFRKKKSLDLLMNSTGRQGSRWTSPLVQFIHWSHLALWITCHTVWEWSQSRRAVLCCDLTLVVFMACPLPVGLHRECINHKDPLFRSPQWP